MYFVNNVTLFSPTPPFFNHLINCLKSINLKYCVNNKHDNIIKTLVAKYTDREIMAVCISMHRKIF